MTTHKFIISGFGGQGVMSMGMMLAYAGMLEGKEVTWLPSYGPEMRGGTANCQVIISDEAISSPIITKATSVIAMNLPSLKKFENEIEDEGDLFINSALIDIKAKRKEVHDYYVPANDIAARIYSGKVSNMVMLGAVIEKTCVVKLETLEKVLDKMFKGSKAKLIPVNQEALKEGAALPLN